MQTRAILSLALLYGAEVLHGVDAEIYGDLAATFLHKTYSLPPSIPTSVIMFLSSPESLKVRKSETQDNVTEKAEEHTCWLTSEDYSNNFTIQI